MATGLPSGPMRGEPWRRGKFWGGKGKFGEMLRGKGRLGAGSDMASLRWSLLTPL